MDKSVIWSFITSGSGFAQAIVLAIISAVIARAIAPKGKLIWSTSHRYAYSMRNDQGGHFLVETQQLWIQNVGKAAVEQVEIVLNYAPQHFEIWNPRTYDGKTLDDGRLVLTFPFLASREFFTISILNTSGPIPDVVSARCKSGAGRAIAMAPMRVFPQWVAVMLVGFALFGVASLIWFLLQLLVS